jgi:hemerythrin-like domain-containing protein
MGALDGLRREHQVILSVLDQMERAVRGSHDVTETVPFLSSCLGFLKTYLGTNHHGKEERALFPLMHADPTLRGYAEALREEHVEGDEILARLHSVLERPGDGSRIRHLTESFAAFLRDHIAREDSMVFEAVEALIGSDAADRLTREFERIETEALGGRSLTDLMPAQPSRSLS